MILGDGVELREAAHRDAADITGDVFADLGRALGPDGELLWLAGNHDHGLVAGFIDGRLQQERPGFLGLETRIDPAQAGPLATALAERARPARVSMAYPGAWLREDVYAIHGHYMDLHSTVPTFERLAAGSMARWVTHMPDGDASPEHYEAALAPLYAFMHQLTQRADHTALSAGAGASARVLVALSERRRTPKAAVLRAGYVAAVTALDRLGMGPLERDLSGASLRRGGLYGIGEVLRRLDVRAPHVVFGHTHRSGPWPLDAAGEWTAPTGSRLTNTGSWVYQPHFLSARPNESPYWPGTAVLLEDGEPPRLIRLLGDRGHPELAAPA